MTSKQEYHNLHDRFAALRETLADRLGADLIENPQLADAITDYLDDLQAAVVEAEAQKPVPPDSGLAELAGIGPEAAEELGETFVPPTFASYDETVTSERILAVGDLYSIFQHEKLGVFRAVLKLQELFRAGSVRLSSGAGAYGLYQYDRRQVLRYTRRERMQAYRRAFGYTNITPPTGAKPNRDFHTLFVHFVTQVAQFYRDKRIADIIRTRATDPGYGSIAVVRRAGLDLRNNLKHASYGHINVLRVEVLQLLNEAFRILGTDDIRKLFGADNAWDVIDEVMRRYLNQPHLNASQRSRMAEAGRKVIFWLAQPHILNASRAEFEALLDDIGDDAEEWLTSAESLGITRSRQPVGVRRSRNGRTAPTPARREFELEY
jgi:hypothetical protein